jgi:hypothetical protein
MIEAQQEEEIVPPQATILKPDLIIRKSSGV